MAYASITYTSASGTTFALTNSSGDPIEYLRQADIAVTVNGVLQTQGTDYTFNSAGTAIILSTSVTSATVVITRTTSITDATVSFTAGSTLTAQDLNNSDKQNRFALQEFSDTYAAITTGTGDLSALAGFIGSAETWLSDNAHAATTGAIDVRVDSKIDTALTGDVVAGNAITITDNSPASGQITIAVTDGAIEAAELASNAVTTAKIADGNVTAAKLASDSVTTAKILDANVTTAKIANDAITSAKIADGTIIAGDIAADAITTAKILDANVTTAKIADANITTAKLADSSVTSAKIADGTIVAGDLASDSVTTAKIADSNVTTGKINDSAVTTAKIADSAVTAIKIADGVITSAKLNASTVVTAAEQSGSTPDDTSFFTTSASDGRYVNVTGDTMTGALAMSSNKITGLGTPTANADAATKQYVDGLVAAATLADADYGDITVSGGATVWTIDNGVVTSAKLGSDLTVDLASGSAATPSLTFDANTGIYSPGADQVAISTNGTGRLFVDASGNVGIAGTPSNPLDVFGSATLGIRYKSSGDYAKIVADNTSSTGGGYFSAYQNGNQKAIFGVTGGFLGDTSADTGLLAETGQAIRFFTNGSATEKARIDSSGRLGIGTSSPQAVLESKTANVQPGDAAYAKKSVVANIPYSTSNVTSSALAVYDGTIHAADIGYSYDGTGYYLTLGTNDDTVGSPTERLRIDRQGRVGIGTQSPAAKLHIGGVSAVTDAAIYIPTGGIQGDNGGVFEIANVGNTTSELKLNTRGTLTFYKTTTGSLGGGSEMARFDSSGRLLVGTSTSASAGGGTNIQQIFSSTNDRPLGVHFGGASSTGPYITLSKSRNTGYGSYTIVNNGDVLGGLIFAGDDGTDYQTPGAYIEAYVDGTPGANDLPTRLVFSTTQDGQSSPVERMRITSDAFVLINTTTPGSASGITLHPGGYIIAAPTYSLALSTSPRAMYMDSGGYFGYLSSTRNSKENIQLQCDVDWLYQLEPVTFNYKIKDRETGEYTGVEPDLQFGLIAEDVEAVCPDICFYDETENGKELRGIYYEKLITPMLKALQQANQRIEALEAEVAALKGA